MMGMQIGECLEVGLRECWSPSRGSVRAVPPCRHDPWHLLLCNK